MSERIKLYGELSFAERKKRRRECYEKYVKGWKLRDCVACAGSGYYDDNGSPRCGGCDGTGKERYKPASPAESERSEYANGI